MGSCCRKPSSMEWAGDDWGSLGSSGRSSKVYDEGHAWKEVAPEKKRLLAREIRASSSWSSEDNNSNNNGKVTIKISKKEFEELMGSLGKNIKGREGSRGGSSSAEQVLVRLLRARDNHHHHNAHHRPWRPVLQSIPELD